MTLKPMRNLVYVEEVRKEKTDGGIFIPETFDHQNRPSLKLNAKTDYYEAKILAVGPDVRELAPGDHVLVHTFADDLGKGLFTGESTGEGKRKLIRYPDDIVCAVDLFAVEASA